MKTLSLYICGIAVLVSVFTPLLEAIEIAFDNTQGFYEAPMEN